LTEDQQPEPDLDAATQARLDAAIVAFGNTTIGQVRRHRLKQLVQAHQVETKDADVAQVVDPARAELMQAMRKVAGAWGCEAPVLTTYRRTDGRMVELWLLDRVSRGDSVNRITFDLLSDLKRLQDAGKEVDHPLGRLPYDYVLRRLGRMANRLAISLYAGTIYSPSYIAWATARRQQPSSRKERVENEQRFLIRASYGEENTWADGGPTGSAADGARYLAEQFDGKPPSGYRVYGWYTLYKYVWRKHLYCDRVASARRTLEQIKFFQQNGIKQFSGFRSAASRERSSCARSPSAG